MRLFGVSIRGKWLKSAWVRIPLTLIGLGCLFAAIWFGFPMTGLEIMQSVWLRGGLIGGIAFLILLVAFLKWNKRRRAARALEQSLMPEPVGDGAVIAERMQEAMEKLRKSGGKTYLYDLPWYIIIGPPGAGKTTALANSGIEFPGNDKSGVEGFGGTKNCDWWFAEDAVLIDTAGRYTTQDSDKAADEASWTAFLETLKRGRPNQPINGVILAFSAEDMMTFSEEQLRAHAETVRDRLGEMHAALKIDFPVYVMFTKADIISGFREYFSTFSSSRRKLVWGATFQTKDRKAETWKTVRDEFDALVSRLSDEVVDRMSEEPDGVSRIAIFGLPGQMALMRDNITEFLRRVFEPTQYKTNAILRGFYFTSGTQEGTPIDQVLGAMNRNAGDVGGFQPDFMSGKGKSYFLHDLLSKVIFEEQDWVSHDARAVRRTAILRTVAITLIALVTAGAMGAFGYSFWRNASLVAQAEQDSTAYFAAAQGELNRTVIDDTDPSVVLPYLQNIRLMTAGYGDQREPTMWEGLGLSQRSRVNLAAERAYSDALERMLRPRMILHMENSIPQFIVDGDTAGIYRALKVYLLLGNQQAGASDDEAIRNYFDEVWREEFSSFGQDTLRDELASHLEAMLELDDGREPLLGVDAAIVRDAQEAIVDLPLAEQAYASIKERSATSSVPDWTLTGAVAGADELFDTTDGSSIDSVSVPAMFTFEGYWGFFVDELAQARQRLQEDQWVLGEAASRVGYEQQLSSLERELHRRYQADFVTAWSAALARISMQPLSVDAPNYEKLAKLASPTNSPLRHLMKSISTETYLLRFFEVLDAVDPAALASPQGLAGAIGSSIVGRLVSSSTGASRAAVEYLRDSAKNQQRAGGLSEDTQRRQVERIVEEFADWHDIAPIDGNAELVPESPLFGILAQIGQIRDNRRQSALAPTPMDEQMLQPLLASLTANNTAYPRDVGRLLNEIESEFRSVAEDATIAELNRALNEQVAAFCTEAVAPNYPFGSGRHISPAIFGQFFGPNGRMDQFYSTYLQPHVVRTADGLLPAPNSPIGDRLNPAALRQFERAEKIRLAFFASGSAEPSVGMSIAHTASSPGVQLAILTINGADIQTQPGGAPAALAWPGLASGVSIELFPAEAGRDNTKSFSDGRWAIVDFLRTGRSQDSGNLVDVTHQVGGRTITYRIEFDSITVPFLMPELNDFSCPTSLE